MPTIRFTKKNKNSIICDQGAGLMKTLLNAGIPVASSCGGDGVCAKCRVHIVQGKENLSMAEISELKILSKTFGSKDERLSCQVKVNGDVTIDTGYW